MPFAELIPYSVTSIGILLDAPCAAVDLIRALIFGSHLARGPYGWTVHPSTNVPRLGTARNMWSTQVEDPLPPSSACASSPTSRPVIAIAARACTKRVAYCSARLA